MSIRQHRTDSPEKIRQKIAGLKGRKITVVLANNTSVLGELRSVSDDSIEIMNGRLVTNRYLLREVKELYFDETV
jgi:hypothetical protein